MRNSAHKLVHFREHHYIRRKKFTEVMIEISNLIPIKFTTWAQASYKQIQKHGGHWIKIVLAYT